MPDAFLVLLSLIFFGLTGYGIATGTMPMQYVDIDRAKSPVWFWLAAISGVGAGVLSALMAFKI